MNESGENFTKTDTIMKSPENCGEVDVETNSPQSSTSLRISPGKKKTPVS